MSGEHTSWKGIVALRDPDGHLLSDQLSYVDGYMLGLGDLLRELNKIDQEKNREPETRELLRRVRRTAHNLRSGAKATEKYLLSQQRERTTHESSENLPCQAP